TSGRAAGLAEAPVLAVVGHRREIGLVVESPDGGLRTVADLHLPEKHLQVRLHRAFADGDLARNELVRVTLDETAQDEVLARREGRQPGLGELGDGRSARFGVLAGEAGAVVRAGPRAEAFGGRIVSFRRLA